MSSKTKNFKVIPVIAVIIIAITVTLVLANLTEEQTSQEETFDPRIVFWRHIHGLGFDPEDRTILYIATHGDFYQSKGGGPPIKVDEHRTDYMAFNAPTNPGYPLYASGHPDTGGNSGLIQSTDGGKTWQLVSKVSEPPVDFHAMSVSTTDPKSIIGFDSGRQKLFKTQDGGSSWKILETPPDVSSIAISPLDSEIVIVATSQGLFKSRDAGNSWVKIDSYENLRVFAVAFDENNQLFGSVETFGIVKSPDLGESWESLGNVSLTVTSIAPDSQNKVMYFAGYSSEGYQEVYKISYDLNEYEMIGSNRELR